MPSSEAELVRDFKRLMRQRLGRNWTLVANDIGDTWCFWHDASRKGCIYYDPAAIKREFHLYGRLRGFPTELSFLAFVLSHEFGHALQYKVTERCRLWDKFDARRLRTRAEAFFALPCDYSEDMSDARYLAYRRAYEAIPDERRANRVARLLTGFTPAP